MASAGSKQTEAEAVSVPKTPAVSSVSEPLSPGHVRPESSNGKPTQAIVEVEEAAEEIVEVEKAAEEKEGKVGVDEKEKDNAGKEETETERGQICETKNNEAEQETITKIVANTANEKDEENEKVEFVEEEAEENNFARLEKFNEVEAEKPKGREYDGSIETEEENNTCNNKSKDSGHWLELEISPNKTKISQRLKRRSNR